MAIPGVTDRARLPRLGVIRLGEKRESKSGKEYPAALDHFNFRDCPELAEMFGNECRELYPVMLPADDEEIWFPTSRSAYGQSGLYCRCSDGETAFRVFKPEDQQSVAYLKSRPDIKVEPGDLFELPCPAEACVWQQKGACKNLGRLFIMLPNVPRFGVYEIRTSSFNSIVNVLNVARAVHNMISRVTGVPFALRVEPIQVQPDGRAKTVHVLNLECRASLVQLAGIRKRLAAAGGSAIAMIEAPEDTPEDLFPHGGQALDDTLTQRALPLPRAARTTAELAQQMRPSQQTQPEILRPENQPEREEEEENFGPPQNQEPQPPPPTVVEPPRNPIRRPPRPPIQPPSPAPAAAASGQRAPLFEI